jgi:hypothetical protein
LEVTFLRMAFGGIASANDKATIHFVIFSREADESNLLSPVCAEFPPAAAFGRLPDGG